MIDLGVFTTEDFRYGPLSSTKVEGIINLVSGTKEVETARRAKLTEKDFDHIEKFGEDLVKKHLKEGVHFDYDITLAALAIILVEFEGKFPENFLAELAKLYASKDAPELFWSRKVAKYLLDAKKTADKVKEKVKKHFPDAVFLPVEELGFIFNPPPHMKKLAIETQLIIAIARKDNSFMLVDHEGTVLELPEEAITTSKPEADLENPYLTDYGQTLGFGSYGDLELENEFVITQAKATA